MKKLIEGNSSGRNATNEVPWHNTFNKNASEVGNEYVCIRVINCSNGLLLLTETFKSYLFKGSTGYENLLEALEYYIKNPNDSVPLVLEVTSGKSPDIGIIEDYEGKGTWMKDEKGFIFDGLPASEKKEESSNPFIPRTFRSQNTKGGGTAKPKKTS